MQRDRTLEDGQNVVAVVPKVLGHHDEPLNPSARVARRAQHRTGPRTPRAGILWGSEEALGEAFEVVFHPAGGSHGDIALHHDPIGAGVEHGLNVGGVRRHVVGGDLQ